MGGNKKNPYTKQKKWGGEQEKTLYKNRKNR